MSSTGTILLTGGSSGIGLATAKELAKQDKLTIVIASRTPPVEPLPSNVVFQPLDLVESASVRKLAAAWTYGRISALVFNAGIMTRSAEIKEGVEKSFSVHALNHALLFFLLKDRHLLSHDCRIVFVTTAMHDPKAPGAPAAPHWTTAEAVAKGTDPALADSGVRYATTKLAGMLFAYALARRAKTAAPGWTVLTYEPGFVPGQGSKLSRELPKLLQIIAVPLIPLVVLYFRRQGVVTSTPAATGRLLAALVTKDDVTGMSGKYVLLDKIKPSSEDSYDVAKQEDVWNFIVTHLSRTAEDRARLEAL